VPEMARTSAIDKVRDLQRILSGSMPCGRPGGQGRPQTTLPCEPPRAPTKFGWRKAAYLTPDNLGLINLDGSVIAP
jgi:hypothetical protein